MEPIHIKSNEYFPMACYWCNEDVHIPEGHFMRQLNGHESYIHRRCRRAFRKCLDSHYRSEDLAIDRHLNRGNDDER